MDFSRKYLEEVRQISEDIDCGSVERIVDELVAVRDRGARLFILGNGGSAANASHAVNDFRKMCSIEAFCPTDNVAELTARINDDGWADSYADWLACSHLTANDLIFVLSVGGGQDVVSENITVALVMATAVGCHIVGIVGRDGGATAAAADVCIVIPPQYEERITPHTEEFQSILCHLLACHPRI